MTVVLVLTALLFLGVVVISWVTHKQVAIPLRAVSKSLGEIATRHDLTSRLKRFSDDEIGDIAVAANKLLEEFQRLARTLDRTAQEVSRTMTTLSSVTEGTHVSMTGRNSKLRAATQDFMGDIEAASQSTEAMRESDIKLHRAQVKFIPTHLTEIDDGTLVTERNVSALQGSVAKLRTLADNMRVQIRLLNF